LTNFEFKNYFLNKPACLAPMAGFSDLAFREICLDFGSALAVSEMVSAKGFCYGDKKSELLLQNLPHCHPYGIQIFGSEPAFMAKAAEKIAQKFAPDFLDINMGCPMPKIVNGGAGSKLMTTPKLAFEIASLVGAAVHFPVTAKIRSGFTEQEKNAPEFAKILQQAGVSAIFIHGRTKEQMYAPPADLESIRLVKQSVTIPVIGNGDINCAEDAKTMFEKTGCDGVMIGRGALGNPFIFSDINNFNKQEHLLETRLDIMLCHIKKMCEYKGEKLGILEARKHAAFYTKGIQNAAKFRNEICQIDTFEDLLNISEAIYLGSSKIG
jgi:nifR3 family TIM-barrel protein